LGTVPASIGNLQQLDHLDLSACSIGSLPDEFCCMIKLIELDLGKD